jgi:hypothetical protein
VSICLLCYTAAPHKGAATALALCLLLPSAICLGGSSRIIYILGKMVKCHMLIFVVYSDIRGHLVYSA